MTDKEFKRLGKAQLIEVIYQLQLQIDELEEQKKALEQALEDKRIRIEKAGDIATAALGIHDCFRNAQNAAEQYLNEIKAIREETELERQRILAQAQAEAEAMVAGAAKKHCDSVIEENVEEYGQSHSDNG